MNGTALRKPTFVAYFTKFHAYLSPSKKFDTLDELRACINNAAKRAQEYFA